MKYVIHKLRQYPLLNLYVVCMWIQSSVVKCVRKTLFETLYIVMQWSAWVYNAETHSCTYMYLYAINIFYINLPFTVSLSHEFNSKLNV